MMINEPECCTRIALAIGTSFLADAHNRHDLLLEKVALTSSVILPSKLCLTMVLSSFPVIFSSFDSDEGPLKKVQKRRREPGKLSRKLRSGLEL